MQEKYLAGREPLTAIYELPKEKAGATRQLWESCFPEDSASFLDYYYTEKTKDNRIIVGEADAKIVSMLHRNSYSVVIKGRRLTLDYIVAVATLKPYRGRRYMQQLLTTALIHMHREGRPFTYLMPAAQAIYSPYDFRFIGDLWKLRLKAASDSPSGEGQKHSIGMEPVTMDRSDLKRAAHFMERWLCRFDVYACRDEAYVSRLLKELESEQGEMYFLRKDGDLIGMYASWGIGSREQRLLYGDSPFVEVIQRTPGIMGRITNVEAFLPLLGLTCEGQAEFILTVKDTWIPGNNGRFLWQLELGKSRLLRLDTEDVPEDVRSAERGALPKAQAKTQTQAKIQEKAQAKDSCLRAAQIGEAGLCELAVSIDTLTLWLFGRERVEVLFKDCSGAVYEILNRIDIIHSVYLDEIV